MLTEARKAKLLAEGFSPAVAKQLRAEGVSVIEIADLFGLTKQGVYWHLSSEDKNNPTSSTVKDLRPWRVPSPQQKASPYINMSYHLEYVISRGKGMSDQKIKRLRGWYKFFLDNPNLVLRFDPEIPPNAVAKCGGWDYVERSSEDGGLIIKKDMDLTPQQMNALVIPAELP
ncbi:hypothetical protein O1L55_20640 [Streptomyces albulus]|nr:hypothetical protein [Streptomyces noursei]